MHHAAPVSQRLTIAGPAGSLEARLDLPAETASVAPVFAVICHPHPQYAGTMDNKVVHTLAKACGDLGVPSLRFNFRGVGASEGAYAEGLGETEDALAVVAWGRQRWPGAALWLAGFSFGAAVAVRASAKAPPSRLIAVAPAVDRIDIRGIEPACPWLVVLGDADDTVSPARMLEWAGGLQPVPLVRQKPRFLPDEQKGPQADFCHVEVQVLPGAGHFFHGRLQDLRDAVTSWAAW